MRGLVFNAKGKALMPQIFNYVVVNLLALLQTLGISVGLVRWIFPQWAMLPQVEAITQLNAEAIAHLIGVLTPVITSYFGHKFLTFR
jgi:putative flippase GtrA